MLSKWCVKADHCSSGICLPVDKSRVIEYVCVNAVTAVIKLVARMEMGFIWQPEQLALFRSTMSLYVA